MVTKVAHPVGNCARTGGAMLYRHGSIDRVRYMPRNVCGIRAYAYGRVRALCGTSKTGMYCGKVRVRPRVPSMCA